MMCDTFRLENNTSSYRAVKSPCKVKLISVHVHIEIHFVLANNIFNF